MAKVELGQITGKVLLPNVLIGAHQTALEDREIALGGIRVDLIRLAFADVFLVVIDSSCEATTPAGKGKSE